MLFSLRDAVLEQEGLVAALQAYSAVVRHCSGLQVRVRVGGEAGMRERVAALGGRLHLENRSTGGARVVADIPLPGATHR